MRMYGSVHLCFWANCDAQRLSDQAKLLAIYLLTGPHSNMIGCFRVPNGYITEDLKWAKETVKNAFHELISIKFLTRDETSGWLVIHKFLKWNPIQNPRQGVGVQKIFDAVPTENRVLKPLIDGLLAYGKYLDKGFLNRLQELETNILNPLETLIEECAADKEQDQDQEQDKDQDQDKDNQKIFMSGKPDVDSLDDVNFVSEKQKHSPKTQRQAELKSQALEVIEFLNQKTGRVYRPVDTNLKLIMARLKSGATVMDCRQVIAKKTREWKGDAKMAEYLRPATLFNATKFEQYVGELVIPDEE
jgi:uncharacterized phage protein (TIGR02220 family)